MIIHGTLPSGDIDATINGDRLSVPDTLSNGHRRMIRDLWEFDEEGNRVNTIPDYVPPPAPIPPLPRLAFWLAAAEIGVTRAGIRAHIDAMPEGVEKLQALIYLDDALVYRRADPLLIAMAAAEGITEPELDALWSWAAASYS